MGKLLVNARATHGNIEADPSAWQGATVHYFDKPYVVEVSLFIQVLSDEIEIFVEGDAPSMEQYFFDNSTPMNERRVRLNLAYSGVRVGAKLKSGITSGGPFDAWFNYAITALHE